MARRRRQRFEQSVPAVLGRQAVARPVAPRPAWVLGGLVLAALLAAGSWVGLSPRFYVTNVRVVGATRVPEEAILAASGLANLHIFWVNGPQAEAGILAQLPSVEEARVLCRLPADCTITVVERPPLLTWEGEEGFFWIDAAGGAFAAARPLEDGWLISGPLPTDGQGLVEREVVTGLQELMRLLGDQPVPISYRPGRGLVLDDPAGWRVVLGQGTGMEQRLQVYAAVRTHLLKKGIKPRFVDVRFPQAPYYSEKEEW